MQNSVLSCAKSQNLSSIVANKPSSFLRTQESSRRIRHTVLSCRAQNDKVLWIGYCVAATYYYSGSVCIPALEWWKRGKHAIWECLL